MARRGATVRDDEHAGSGGEGAGTSIAILDAARRLFLDAGYEGVSLEQVGRAAGVSRQTVYNQFGSKDAVFRSVVDRHWETVRTEVAVMLPSPSAEPAEPAEILHGFARALLRFVQGTDQIAFTRLVIAESRHQPWIAEAFYRAGKAPLVAAFAGVLSELTNRRLLCCPHPELAARQFMGLVQEFVIWPHVMRVGGLAEIPDDDTVVEEAVRTFLARYAAHPPG
ncbi:TetR/AcrR family transcriptional regulator [Methylobacterium nodulans]|uniref:Transcriptional regulator, TetR family n=1 Tax=Methylobacterium nodulans (strain LMG 21967 / CNCM I-2342 / ORS 2060) TaxID=460265 RepID=B8IVK7_METNO|nr:TetR/AcrR family transcriptional regulator [Methylobacterium nodulans]ACL62447.1 transcriptional regulator, TetR family [Methylobacterium nodulans ORS 2060]